MTPETAERLDVFAAELLRWNRRMNLISRRDEATIRPRHIEDSLRVAALLPAGTDRVIDLGSGGGFPGLVIAIATGVMVELIEEDARKCAFLREAARVTAAPARIHRARIQHAKLPPASVVTARALAELGDLLALATPLLTANGVCLFPRDAIPGPRSKPRAGSGISMSQPIRAIRRMAASSCALAGSRGEPTRPLDLHPGSRQVVEA